MSDNNSTPSLDAVVAKAYAAIAEPETFIELLTELIETDQRVGGIGDAADMHFENAGAILDKVYPFESANYALLANNSDAHPQCDLALDTNLQVLAINSRVFDNEWISDPDFAAEDLFDPARAALDRDRLKALGSSNDKLFIRLYTREDDEAGRWFGACLAEMDGRDVIALNAVRLRWDEQSGSAFQEAMALTPTETELTKHLVTGGKVREFAELRERSLGTVRNQLKALQRKLAINSKEELLLLYAGFIHSLDPPDEAAQSIDHTCSNIYTEPNGGVVAWEEYGDRGGEPVLFFHPLEGALLSGKVDRAARDAGLRIIAPWRPNYGETTGGKPGPGTPKAFSARLPDFLDHLGVARTIALGTQAGMPYLAAFANSQSHRLHAAVAAGPFFPVMEASDYDFIPVRQRNHYKSSRVAPAFARIYMRALLASMGTGDFYKFVEDFYEGCPRELQTVHTPEMTRKYQRAANYMLTSGPNGPVDTMLNWAAKWGDQLLDLDVPFHVLLGSLDSNTSPAFARHCAARFGFAEPEILDGAGSFLVEDRPEDVFERIRGIFHEVG